MTNEDVWRELGEIRTEIRHLTDATKALDDHNNKCMDDIHARLNSHMKEEDARLQKIEHQLSIARFVLMTVKVVLSTFFLLLTLRFGDIIGLWKTLVK